MAATTDIPTPAELIAKAEAIAETLVERQAETEKRTYYAEDTHEAFREAGFYRILVPRRYGGYELGVDTFMRVCMALARGCPSTGWMFCLGATHALPAATLFGERAQAEIFAGGEFIAPATIVPGGTAERTADGWIVNGTWPYCSGSPYATHFIGHTLLFRSETEPPLPLMFVVPRADFTRLDDWGRQLGLKGSGSHSIRVENAHIPEYYALEGVHISETSTTGGTPGRELHGNPAYGGGPLSYMVLEIASLSVGIAKGALDAYGELMRTRTTLLPPITPRTENADFQFWYGEAAGLISTAEAAVFSTIQQWNEIAGRGPDAFTREEDLRLTTICRHVIRLCWEAVERYLFPTAGSSSVRSGERFERIWRDLSTLHSHAGFSVFLPTVANRERTRVHFDVGNAA